MVFNLDFNITLSTSHSSGATVSGKFEREKRGRGVGGGGGGGGDKNQCSHDNQVLVLKTNEGKI